MQITGVLAYLLVACYFAIERALRKGERALSLDAGERDRGSSQILWASSLVELFLLIIAPTLNSKIIGVFIDEDGVKIFPDGTNIYPDGTQVWANGKTVYPDIMTVENDGVTIYPDGTMVSPDGTVIEIQQQIMNPDGTVTDI